MSLAEEIRCRLLERGVCFVVYEQRTEAVHTLFTGVHELVENQMDVYEFISVHQSVLGMFLSRVELDHGVPISVVRPLGRRLLSLQGQLRTKVLLSLERAQGQEADLATVLSDCVENRRFEPGWFYMLVGITPSLLNGLVTHDPRLQRRYFVGDEYIVRVVE